MEVKIFYYNREQRQEYAMIVDLLKENIYKDLLIEECFISRYGFLSDDYCKQYITLLKSSIIKYEDFNIIVLNNVQNLYYSYYSYFGGLSAYVFTKTYMDIPMNNLKMLFPAVAIMDRMVILPKGIVNAFDMNKASFSWLPRPLEAGGAILVDFTDEESIKDSIIQVEKQLQFEISRLCIRQMAANNIPSPDFDELGRLLKTYPAFIKKHSTKTNNMINIKVKSEQGNIPMNQETLVTLNLINNAERPLGRIRVTIKAPSNTLYGQVSEILEMDYTGKIEFNINPKVKPFCPLEVSIETYELGEVSNPMQYPLILDVI